jgi:hypothetical protein
LHLYRGCNLFPERGDGFGPFTFKGLGGDDQIHTDPGAPHDLARRGPSDDISRESP